MLMIGDLNKPVIGVTMGMAMEDHNPEIHPGYRFEYLKQQYYEILEECGAVIIPLPNTSCTDHSDYYINMIDGLLIVGGEDVEPGLYGMERSKLAGASNIRRDNFEREMVFKAVSRNVPILAICRGHQLVNVTFGGSLYQDLSERQEETLNHLQTPECDFSNIHDVELIEDSRLCRLAKKKQVKVNSAHHQIVRNIPKGLKAVAFASDGVVEALEGTDNGYIQTVQWHPEMDNDDRFTVNLFKDFIDNTREYRKKNRPIKT
jgi:putative glutamine amidotransferase